MAKPTGVIIHEPIDGGPWLVNLHYNDGRIKVSNFNSKKEAEDYRESMLGNWMKVNARNAEDKAWIEAKTYDERELLELIYVMLRKQELLRDGGA